jgi:hypothetical protein
MDNAIYPIVEVNNMVPFFILHPNYHTIIFIGYQINA